MKHVMYIFMKAIVAGVSIKPGLLGIASCGKIPWNVPGDMKWFVQYTKNSVVIMGRKTWDSLKVKPLPNRINIVLSNTLKIPDGGVLPDHICLNIEQAVNICKYIYSDKNVVLIGGGKLYEDFFNMGLINEMSITFINPDVVETGAKFDVFVNVSDVIQTFAHQNIEICDTYNIILYSKNEGL